MNAKRIAKLEAALEQQARQHARNARKPARIRRIYERVRNGEIADISSEDLALARDYQDPDAVGINYATMTTPDLLKMRDHRPESLDAMEDAWDAGKHDLARNLYARARRDLASLRIAVFET